MKSENILKNILRINIRIKDNLFSKTEFYDECLEEKFQDHSFKSKIKKTLVSNLLIFLGYITTLLYILIAFYKAIYLINCCICFFVAIISLIICNLYKTRKMIFINEHFQIFLSSINLLNKGYILCLFYNSNESDNAEELLRIIIYDFVSINIYLITKLEANIFVSVFYFLLNFSLIILGYYTSVKPRFYFLESFTSFCVFLIFYLLRKQWDSKIRLIYAEKIKFEKYFLYTIDYLEGLNGYSINVQNNKIIYYGEKINTLISKLLEQKFLSDSNSIIDNRNNVKEKNEKAIEQKIENSKCNNRFENENSKVKKNKTGDGNLLFSDQFENGFKNENSSISFLKKLIFYKKSASNNNNSKNADFSYLNENSHDYLENKEKGKSLYNYIFQNEGTPTFSVKKINNLNTNIKQELILENMQENLNENDKIINKDLDLKNISELYKNMDSPKKKTKNMIIQENLFEDKKSSSPFFSDRNPPYKYKEEGFNKILKNSKISQENDDNESIPEVENFNKSLFQSIGIYFLKNTFSKKRIYYNIFHRKIYLQEGNKIDNFFFQDITDLIHYQIEKIEENFKKQKIFAKISHEFKTPLNSIVGMTKIIKESDLKLSKLVNQNLAIISNLSNYMMFLISDIIQFVNIQELNDLKVYICDLNIKEILEFCYQILNTLLSCNKLKGENVESVIYIHEEIEQFQAESDENRIKQIILNFISNAVKYTREGRIKLKCEVVKNENQYFIKISVNDSGLGIREEDKAKLFKDFGVIENEWKIKNNFGTGLGLSICKSIAERLNLKLNFKSEYMKGSKFYILIPCRKKEKCNKIESISYEILSLKQKSNRINEVENIDKISLITIGLSIEKNNIVDKKSKFNDFNSNENFENNSIDNVLIDSNQISYIISNENSKNFIDKINNKTSNFSKKSNIIDIESESVPTINNENNFNFGIDDYETICQNLKGKCFNWENNNNEIIQIPKKFIILADDNDLINSCNKKIILEILNENQNNDFEIFCVYDGIDIIKLFISNEENENIMLIITDENMEFFNGSEAIKIIRKIELMKKKKRVKIISLSCHEDKNMGDLIIKSGADFIMTKPLSKQSIKSFLQNNIL